MKKIWILLAIILVMASGCGKKSEEKVLDKFKDTVKGAKSYTLKANMEIYSNEDTFTYAVEVNYLKDDYYKVYLVNQTNDHEQIILKNKDGVYVVTPSLNKSFKFQSDWPNSSSQSYLLGPIVSDLEKDDEVVTEKKDKEYVLTTEVDYPNNEELVYEKLYFNEDYELKRVEVFNEDDALMIKVMFSSIDYKAKLSEDDFKLDDLIDQDCCGNGDEQTGSLDDIIYPLYIPSNTYLKSKETVSVDNGERAILTFAGDRNFVLVEEASMPKSEFEIIPVYGEPLMLSDTIGVVSANSLSWTSNNIDYYLASSDLSTYELMTIAGSLNNPGTIVGK